MRNGLVAALLGLVWAGSVAAAPLLDGELGRWLEQEVAPELGETLARHPRFHGETIRLTVVTPGQPGATASRLGRAVEQRLRERLLARPGLVLATDGAPGSCGPRRSIDYLVRVELAPTGARQARVHVAVVDVAEAVWVSGISYRWQGRLSQAEQRALAALVPEAAPGSAGSPVPVADAARVADLLTASLRCTVPHGFEGPVFVDVPEQGELARLGVALKASLKREPLAAVTADRERARWLLHLEDGEGGSDVRELGLVLSDSGGGSRQRLAAVFVAGAAEPPSAALAETAPRGSSTGEPAPPAPLLSALRLERAASEGICDRRRARVNSCVEVGFDLHQSAYLFVLSTRDHQLTEAPCGEPLAKAEPGPRRYRLRIPPGRYAVDAADTGPDAGFYVIAVADRSAAAALARAFEDAPGICGVAGTAAAADWLDGLAAVLRDASGSLDWRAMHLVHGSGGIAAL